MTVSRIDIKTGFGCNNRCVFCVQGDKRDEYGDKTTDELKALLKEGRQDADQVVFTGGEVTIRKDLPALVAEARGLGFRVIQIQTNGRMLSSNTFLDQLIEAGATEFSPAIHGPIDVIHDAQTRVPNSFRQTVKGVRNVKERGYPVLINAVITRMNMPYLPAMARLFVKLEVDQFQLAFVHALGTAGQNFEAVVPRLSLAAPFIRQALAIGRNAGMRCMTEAVPLCFLGPYTDLAAEWIIPRTKIFDANRVVEDFTEARLAHGKLKGEPCTRCKLNDKCEGPWREYPERFGWDEFKPITG